MAETGAARLPRRCVKRYLAREVYHAILADFEALHAT
jgi:hypothetical protein